MKHGEEARIDEGDPQILYNGRRTSVMMVVDDDWMTTSHRRHLILMNNTQLVTATADIVIALKQEEEEKEKNHVSKGCCRPLSDHHALLFSSLPFCYHLSAVYYRPMLGRSQRRRPLYNHIIYPEGQEEE